MPQYNPRLVAASGIGVFAVSLLFLLYDSAAPLVSARRSIGSIQDVPGGADGDGDGGSRSQRAPLLIGRRGDDGLSDQLLR